MVCIDLVKLVSDMNTTILFVVVVVMGIINLLRSSETIKVMFINICYQGLIVKY